MKLSKEIKTAIMVISSILLFIWGYSFLKGRDILSNYKTFLVKYDNVEGLAISAPVTINGLTIGKVNKISLDNQTGKITVELQLKSDFPISKTSKAFIYEPGLIGGKQIMITPNLQDNVMAEDGSFLEGGIKPGLTALVAEKLTPLQEKIEKMVVSADVLLMNLNKTLDAKTRDNIKSTVENLNETLVQFKIASTEVNGMIADNKGKINKTFTNIDKVASNFSKVSDSLTKVNIIQTVNNLENTLANIDKLMLDLQSGKGTMGKMLKDEALYTNFNKTSKELELLLQDLRLNPTRYVNVSLFGKKNKPYIAPKNDTIKK